MEADNHHRRYVYLVVLQTIEDICAIKGFAHIREIKGMPGGVASITKLLKNDFIRRFEKAMYHITFKGMMRLCL